LVAAGTVAGTAAGVDGCGLSAVRHAAPAPTKNISAQAAPYRACLIDPDL